MASIQYRLFAWACRHFVKPAAAKEVRDVDKYMEKMRAQQRKFKLPLEKLHKQYNFHEKNANGTTYYAIHPHSGKAKRLVLYFFGGGFTVNGDSGDFEFGQDMADQTQADVWLVWYPLLPDATGTQIMDAVVNVYKEGLKLFDAKAISFFGLSAGASLCVIACIHLKENYPQLPMPGRIIPHSPCLWEPPTKEQQEKMYAMDHRSAMMPACAIIGLAEYVSAMDLGPYDYFKNPVNSDWKGLPPMFVLFGGDEVLSVELPDIEAKCREDGVALTSYVAEGMMHTWSAAGFLPEAGMGRERIYRYIRENEDYRQLRRQEMTV